MTSTSIAIWLAKSLTLMSYVVGLNKVTVAFISEQFEQELDVQRSLWLVVWENVKFRYFYMVPVVCRFRGLPCNVTQPQAQTLHAADFYEYTVW